MFSYQKLEVYHHASEWLALSSELIKSVPRGNSDLVQQLRRAALSVPLNIAEGAGKTSKQDKKRFYSIARGSVLECAALLDAMKILKLCDEEAIEKELKVLHDLASMLTALTLRWK